MTNKTHGLLKHPLYSAWHNIKQRCYNPKHPGYHRYGGRGISMCELWLNAPATFIEDILTSLGPRPAEMTLHRIDNDGHYELLHGVTGLQQVKWANAQEQSIEQERILTSGASYTNSAAYQESRHNLPYATNVDDVLRAYQHCH